MGKAGQAGKVPEQVKARVAEGADSVEQAVIKSLAPAVQRHKAQTKQRRPRQLDAQRHAAIPQGQADQPGKCSRAHGFADHYAVLQRNTPSQQHHHQRGEDHKAQAARLNEQQQNDLSKQG